MLLLLHGAAATAAGDATCVPLSNSNDMLYTMQLGLGSPPQMVDGSLIKSMEQEHCDRVDSRIVFTSSNGLTSKSCDEWEVALESEALPPRRPRRRLFEVSVCFGC